MEDLDALVIGPVLEKVKERFGEVRLLVMPDHATPVKERTHTSEPVPFIIYDSRVENANAGATYDESIATRNGIMIVDKGYTLMDYFIKEAVE